MSTPLLQLRAIRKSFGGVEVLQGVDFDVYPAEVHALCGENGAGKSTLMNIIAGVHAPDAGEIILGPQRFPRFASAHAARQAGVSIVFQERSLFAPLTVAENIFAGRQPVRSLGRIDRRRLRSDTAQCLQDVAPEVSPDAIVADLSPAEQQMVEIAKALSLDARVVIFDEPTAALTETETQRLFAVIRRLRARQVGVVYISHRLDEFFALADRVTVLKDGAWQGTFPIAQTNPDELIRRMVGRAIARTQAEPRTAAPPSLLLDVRGLSDRVTGHAHRVRLRNISFHACAGEVVGLAGLAGAGRTETALSLFGARPRGAGEVWVDGRQVDIRRPTDAIAAGLGYVSEDRKESGLFLAMSIRRNVSAARLDRFGRWFYREDEESLTARQLGEKLRLACRDVDQDAGHLSGGNQQKVLLARWLLVNPRVLIVDEPTRGVDVGAKAEVHQLLREFARQGHAVVLISSDLPEVLAVSHRIYVMRAGEIAGELGPAEASEESVMRLAAGGHHHTMTLTR
jgi:ABC-type sugar transport system ATPase subunit